MASLHELTDPKNQYSTIIPPIFSGSFRDCIEKGVTIRFNDNSKAYSILDVDGVCLAAFGLEHDD